MMTIKPDTYTLYARFFPGILAATPLFVLWFFLARETEWKDLLNFVLSLKFLGTVSISAAFLYFYSQFIRITSKHFERKYFTGSRGFPTTYFMLYADQTYSSDYKDKFRERVKKILKLDPLNVAEESAQPQEARNRLNEAFNHIRLKVGNGKLVLKHNIWYGFSRNLIGGAIYASIFCAANIGIGWAFFKSPPLVIVSAVLLAVYLCILIFHKPILFQNAEAYARQLISEFMTTSKATTKE
jgi:hypothetical protein